MIWPRQYASQIIALHTKEERRAALEKVPEEWRPFVKSHVEIAYDRRRARKVLFKNS